MTELPIIDTSMMEWNIRSLLSQFVRCTSLPALWICGREESFGLRPSQKKKHLAEYMIRWNDYLKDDHIVVVPVVFYSCDQKDAEESTVPDKNFLAANHYNILISWLDNSGSVCIERYEPDSIKNQKDLDSRLHGLLNSMFNRDVTYSLVAKKGLQARFGDKRLCGYHILYWMVYRLKYGLKAALMMLKNPNHEKFEVFCNAVKSEF